VTWALDSLSAPSERLALDTRASALAFSSSSPNTFFVACLSGSLLCARRHGDAKGVSAECVHHGAPLTARSLAPQAPLADYDRRLAASVDWTVSLWRSDTLSPLAVIDTGVSYVYALAWSPSSASVFAVGTADGRVLLYNLLHTALEPASVWLSSPDGATSLSFAADGSLLAVGCADGSVHVLNVPPAHIGEGTGHGLADVEDELARLGQL
jgi:hypothetical protein